MTRKLALTSLAILLLGVAYTTGTGCTSNNNNRNVSSNNNYSDDYDAPQRDANMQNRNQGQQSGNQDQASAEQPVTILQMATREGKVVPGEEYVVYADIDNPSNRDLTFRWEIENARLLQTPEEKRTELLNQLREGNIETPESNQPVPDEDMMEQDGGTEPDVSQQRARFESQESGEVSEVAEQREQQARHPTPGAAESAGSEDDSGESSTGDDSESEQAAESETATETETTETTDETATDDETTTEEETQSVSGLITPENRLLAEEAEDSGDSEDSGESDSSTSQAEDGSESEDDENKDGGESFAAPVDSVIASDGEDSGQDEAGESDSDEDDGDEDETSGEDDEQTSGDSGATPELDTGGNAQSEMEPGAMGIDGAESGGEAEASAEQASLETGDSEQASATRDFTQGERSLMTKDPAVSFIANSPGKVKVSLTVLNLKGEELTDQRDLIVEVTEPEPKVDFAFNRDQVMVEGSFVYVDLTAENIPDYRRGLFNVTFDNDRLSFRQAAVGDFFPSEDDVDFFYAQPSRDNGKVTLALKYNVVGKTLSGDGTLATLRFRTRKSIDDPSSLSFSAERDPSQFYILDSQGDNQLPPPDQQHPVFANNQLSPAGGGGSGSGTTQRASQRGQGQSESDIDVPDSPGSPAQGEQTTTEESASANGGGGSAAAPPPAAGNQAESQSEESSEETSEEDSGSEEESETSSSPEGRAADIGESGSGMPAPSAGGNQSSQDDSEEESSNEDEQGQGPTSLGNSSQQQESSSDVPNFRGKPADEYTPDELEQVIRNADNPVQAISEYEQLWMETDADAPDDLKIRVGQLRQELGGRR